MLTDYYDLPISTTSQAAQTSFNLGIHKLLGHEADTLDTLRDAVGHDPGFAMAHAVIARAQMFAGDLPAAAAAIAQAEALSGGVTRREKSHIAAMALLVAGKGPQAYAAIRAHVAEHPRDAVVAQTCSTVFGLIGFSGRPGREAETLAYLAGLAPHYGEDWWFLSQYAFALCETGSLAQADAMIEQSLKLNRANAQAAHVRSHTWYEMGEAEAGRAFLTEWLDGYDQSGMLHGHLSWHVALWALYAGDVDTMWARVDAAVSPTGATHSLPINVLTDTASILHRAELMGVDVPASRWAEISAYAAQKFPNCGNAFVDVHAALAHAMAGNGDALRKIISDPAGPAADLVPDLACGYRLLADQDFAASATHFTKAMHDLDRIGGSRAQRDLVEQSLLSVLMRQGRAEEAKRIAVMRRPVLAETVDA